MSNFFNTNIINPSKHNISNSSPRIINIINKFLSSSKNVSNDYLTNTNRHIEYLGEGINGSMYKVRKVNSSSYYIIKLIQFNKSTYPLIKRELALLKKIEENSLTKDLINPCIDYYLSLNMLISVFKSFNGITVLQFIKECHDKNIDGNTKIILLKYLLKQCFDAISQIHLLKLCHLQINPYSILVKINVSKLSNENNISSATSDFVLYDNTNVVLNESQEDKDKIIPTNYNIYSIEDSNEPIQIKLTNFGLGCGILPKLDSDLNVTIHTDQVKCEFYNTDPYLNEKDSNMSNLDLGMHFDFFNTGLIGLMCLCNWEFIKSEMLESSNFSKHIMSIDSFNDFLDMCGRELIHKSLSVYFNNIRTYCLGDLNKRKNSKFVQEKIMLDEKHNNDSFW
jgi:hypothetical protein